MTGGTTKLPPICSPSVPTRRISEYRTYLNSTNVPLFHRHIHLAQIPQHKIHQRLILLLAQPPHKALTRKLLPEPIRRQAILGEAEVKHARYIEPLAFGTLGYELLLLFFEVGAADETDGALCDAGQRGWRAFRGRRRDERGLRCRRRRRGRGFWGGGGRRRGG